MIFREFCKRDKLVQVDQNQSQGNLQTGAQACFLPEVAVVRGIVGYPSVPNPFRGAIGYPSAPNPFRGAVG